MALEAQSDKERTLPVGAKVTVHVGRQHMSGHFWAGGWYVGEIVETTKSPTLGLRYTVRTRYATIKWCDPECVKPR